MKPYPSPRDKSLNGANEMLQYISRERDNDIRDWNNLTNIYMRGRKVGKVPSSSIDVDDSDRLGDFNYTASFYYILVDNSGAAEWRRMALASW